MAFGNEFPAFESIISDGRNQIFIGGSFAGDGQQTGPFTGLDGPGTAMLLDNSFEITLDSEGYFTGVMFGDSWYSKSEWNGESEFNMTVEQFGSGYPELYELLFGEKPQQNK